MSFDSRPDTWLHIATVQGLLHDVIVDLMLRQHEHDRSKLEEPELSVFDEYTPKLRDTTYNSEEYKDFLAGMSEGLRHHYESNDHHPEHHEGGIHDMDLIQLVEMLADWKAATLRHGDGNLDRSIRQNAERFCYGASMISLLQNTARRMGWL